ncbi:MAG: CCA tRNA nucleotidyltransferase [Candidatus Glassbacteria bacterium]|nr:CCA tRNA nucleotidyltransferase [Candidatus Glassbacteria bacterium]
MGIEPGTIEAIRRLAVEIAGKGGRAFYVGGYVRDSLLGRAAKDVDVEVYGLDLDSLQGVLEGCGCGKALLVGRQFGVLRLEDLDADWSVPRTDSSGRRPRVAVDPSLAPAEAARRRDLTMNAMLMDVLGGEVLDPWGGREDLERGVLRTPDPEKFVEDPLRYYRVMQFAARFEMKPDRALAAVCRRMKIAPVAAERVEDEFAKLLLEARRPSLGLRFLDETGRLSEVLPELVPLKETPQEPDWHPEGDVWGHTLQVVDAAAGLRSGARERDLMLAWAALCHDLGKPATTTVRQGRIRTPEHDRESARLAGGLLNRLVRKNKVVRKGALKLVAQHMKPMQFFQNRSTAKGFKRLALKLAPEADLELLSDLALADFRGTNPEGDGPLAGESMLLSWFREQARASGVEREPERPVLMGRHLDGFLEPGPDMGKVLERAYRIQLDEGIRDVETLRRRVLGEKGKKTQDNNVPKLL